MDEILVHRLKKADITVRGKLIGHATCAPESIPEGDAWSEVQLREAADGSWVAIGLRPGINLEHSVGAVRQIEKPKIITEPDGIYGLHGNAKDEDEAKAIMIHWVMEFFEWSWLAKRMAGDLGWDLLRSTD